MEQNKKQPRPGAFACHLFFAGAVLCAAAPEAWCYDVETHAEMSRAAANQSVLGVPSVLERLGLRPLPIGDPRQTFQTSQGGTPVPIVDLIRFGARWEDNLSLSQALRHFYDPVNDRALDVGGTLGTSLSIRSPDWALEDVDTYTAPFATQEFSYKHARDYLYNALTANSELQRRQFFGLTFQTLGHVIHHLQDMAQPQHARNDAHCDAWLCQAAAILAQNKLFYAPSLYEEYTNLDSSSDPINRIRSNLPYSGTGSAPVYPGSNAATVPFKTPRNFWRTTPVGSDIALGKGISEYTNRNFFSAGTIYRYDQLGGTIMASPPQLLNVQSPDVFDVTALLPGTNLTGVVYFFRSTVTDALSGQTDTNYRAASHSIFAPELLNPRYSTQTAGLYYSLNRFTFDAAHQFLIPRAVGYSTGMINYFFRGQMEISMPDEGVYSIVDHNDPTGYTKDSGGFGKIKLKIRNVTPGGTDAGGNAISEPMDPSSGQLRAVAKFHRNTCYQPDLSGEYGSPGIDWHTCRSPSEEIVVSTSVTVPSGINSGPVAVAFNFPNPIPINATDLYLQVVYRGPLGEETDAVVVATKDISEPTYVYQYERWDQYLYCNYGVISSDPPCGQIYTFKQSFCDQLHSELTYDQCKALEGETVKFRANPISNPLPGYDPANPAVTPGELHDLSLETPFLSVAVLASPVGTVSRVAILTDVSPPDPYLLVEELGVGANMVNVFQWQSFLLEPTINQLDPATSSITTSRKYGQARGIYVDTTPYSWNSNYSDYILLRDGNAPDIQPLIAVPSQINF